ncbi:MAG: hypothetical protein ABFD97_05205 [Syntrophobacter sp.]
MFHSHFFLNGFFTGSHDATVDAVELAVARKVVRELHSAWMERREQQLHSGRLGNFSL